VTQILLVEDHDDLRDTLHALLALRGYGVQTAKNGREALEVLLDEGPPDIVVMDLMMPEMTGWQLRTEMLQRAELASIPVIVITAAKVWQHQLPPAAAYLKKPFHADELYRLIDQKTRRCD
jgi:CheY-like chemotaxis protein